MGEQQPKITPKEVGIEIIAEHHRADLFQSYEKELVYFLKEDALENQKQRLSITFL